MYFFKYIWIWKQWNYTTLTFWIRIKVKWFIVINIQVYWGVKQTVHSSAASYPPVHILRLVRHPEKFQRHLFLEMFFEMGKLFNMSQYHSLQRHHYSCRCCDPNIKAYHETVLNIQIQYQIGLPFRFGLKGCVSWLFFTPEADSTAQNERPWEMWLKYIWRIVSIHALPHAGKLLDFGAQPPFSTFSTSLFQYSSSSTVATSSSSSSQSWALLLCNTAVIPDNCPGQTLIPIRLIPLDDGDDDT